MALSGHEQRARANTPGTWAARGPDGRHRISPGTRRCIGMRHGGVTCTVNAKAWDQRLISQHPRFMCVGLAYKLDDG